MYTEVKIQDLSDKNPNHRIADDNAHIDELLEGVFDWSSDFDSEDVYFQNTNCRSSIEFYGNAFLGAFMMAYNNHRDVILSPTDIWNMVMMMLSKHINDNAEALRDHFVSHKDKITLTIV